MCRKFNRIRRGGESKGKEEFVFWSFTRAFYFFFSAAPFAFRNGSFLIDSLLMFLLETRRTQAKWRYRKHKQSLEKERNQNKNILYDVACVGGLEANKSKSEKSLSSCLYYPPSFQLSHRGGAERHKVNLTACKQFNYDVNEFFSCERCKRFREGLNGRRLCWSSFRLSTSLCALNIFTTLIILYESEAFPLLSSAVYLHRLLLS